MMWFKCKYNRYQTCDIDEPETACEGCEEGLKCLKLLNEPNEPDPDREYEQARDEGRRLTT